MPSDWERVDADPALLDAARRRYTGDGDLADQLWWIDHPGTRAPSGAEDPVAAVDAARAALYRPGADASAATEVTRLTAALEHHRQQARTALRTAEAERPRSSSAAAGRAPKRRPLGPVLGAVVAALLVGGVAGLAIGRFSGTPAPAALKVFDRSQAQHDRPPATASLPSFVDPSSTRLLGTSTTTGAYLYAAKTKDSRICLVAIVLATRYLGTCTTEAAFAISGLTLTLQATVDPEDDSGVVRPREITPSWSPAGALTF